MEVLLRSDDLRMSSGTPLSGLVFGFFTKGRTVDDCGTLDEDVLIVESAGDSVFVASTITSMGTAGS